MKKAVILLLALVGFSFGGTWYQGTDRDLNIPFVPKTPYFSWLAADVKLPVSDTVYTKPIDLLSAPIYAGETTADGAIVPSLLMGDVMVSCYDISDSSGVDDSVKVAVQLYKSQYAGDNVNPNSAKSDAWATLGSAITLSDVSNSNAIVEGTAAVTLGSVLDRFVRVRILNSSDVAKNVPRCRVVLVRKQTVK